MYTVLIAGPSGSGKTTFIKILTEMTNCVSLSIDQFYKTQTGEKLNWDSPEAIDWTYLYSAIKDLNKGLSATIPTYNFNTSSRSGYYKLTPPKILLIEGIFALDERLCELANLTVYIDADPVVCLGRRYSRDVLERGRDGEDVIHQYTTQVMPGYLEYVLPSKSRADIICNGSGEFPTQESNSIKVIACAMENRV